MRTDLALACDFARAHPAEAAQILESLQLEEVAFFLRATPPRLAAEVVRFMNLPTAAKCLEYMEPEPIGERVAQLPLEIAVLLLRRLEEDRRASILQILPRDHAEPLRLLLRYSEGTAGALMDPLAFTLPVDIAVEQALQRVRDYPQHVLHYLYVVDREHALVGVVNMRELMLAHPHTPIASIMHPRPVSLRASTALPAVLAHPGWLDFHLLPVVDDQDLFVGILRNKTLRRLVSEASGPRRAGHMHTAGTALGELYGIGLAGLLKGATVALGSKKSEYK